MITVKYYMLYQIEIATHGVAPEIQFTVKFNDQIIDQYVCDNQTHVTNYDINDSDDDLVLNRCFQIMVNGKNQTHTVIAEDGSIKSDCYAILSKIIFDDIDVTIEYCQGQATYLHDNNGTSEMFDDEFYGFLGCNGTVILPFSTPVHLWMLKKCQ